MMFNQELAKKIDILIKEKFPIIYEYKFDGIVLLFGGTIRNIIMGTPIKDLDFVILTQEKCQILDFIEKNKLKYKKNLLDSYKILWNNIKIDMCSTDDLLDVTEYDTDMMFYDIETGKFILCGVMKAIENRTITHINKGAKVNYTNKKRVNKIISFIKFMSRSDKKVKVKTNIIVWNYKLLMNRIKRTLNRLNGNYIKCFRFLKNCKKDFIIIIILGIIISFLSLVEPAISGMIVSNLMETKYNIIVILILLLLLSRALMLMLQFLMSKLYLVINKTMINNIRKEILNSVLNLEMNNFNNNNRGAFLEKLNSDPQQITKNFNGIKDVLIRGGGNFGLIVYMFVLDYRIGLLLCLFLFILMYVIVIGIRKKKKYKIAYYKSQEKYSSILGEMINGVDDIKKLDLKENYTRKTISSFNMVSENEFQANYYQKVYEKIAGFVELVAILSIMLLGLYLVKNNFLVVSALVIIFMYNSTLFSFVNKIGLLFDLLSNLNISCNRVFSLIDGNLYDIEIFGTKYNNACKGTVEFKNVKFRYNYKSNYVINDFSFVINANELVAIVGKSGEGKTTILNLLSRLYSVDSGKILIDGIDIKEYNEKFIRDNISVISQSPYLFDMSIKENLRLVKDNITDEEIIDVCKKVCLDEFIENLPEKYDTTIGEGGIKLSGGQKQRLGIARALIKNTKIILLDEITSALDNETGSVIKKVINNIKKNHTVIVVTHELSMIKDADRILVLDNGKIVGDGKHKDLLKNNEVYKKLYKLK